MGLFHLKKGTPASKALPEKSTLKDGICLDFLLPREEVQLQSPALQERETLYQLEKYSRGRSTYPAQAHGEVGLNVARHRDFQKA
jgi:hypothetical protein